MQGGLRAALCLGRLHGFTAAQISSLPANAAVPAPPPLILLSILSILIILSILSIPLRPTLLLHVAT